MDAAIAILISQLFWPMVIAAVLPLAAVCWVVTR